MTAIQSRNLLQPQYPAADTKKIQKETSFAWKTARVAAVAALIVGVWTVSNYYKQHTIPPKTETTSDYLIDGSRYHFTKIYQSSVNWWGDVTSVIEHQDFKNDVLIKTSKRTHLESLFGQKTITDCDTGIKLDLETCLKTIDNRLVEQCVTFKSKQDCVSFSEPGRPMTIDEIVLLHQELKAPYL